MRWTNILEAICAFPSVVLDTIVIGMQKIYLQERDLVENGEFDEEEVENDRSE